MHLSTLILILCEFKVDCQDTDNGALDRYWSNCEGRYNKYPEVCGNYDDEDFTAHTMCCACKGNYDFGNFSLFGKFLFSSDQLINYKFPLSFLKAM